MKRKLPFFQKQILEKFWSYAGVLLTIISAVLIFCDISDDKKFFWGIFFLIVLLIIYIAIWFHANKLKKISISINNSSVDLFFGDIFKEKGLKVIAFNEYFDTKVDDKIISNKSLNGAFIFANVKNVEELNDNILNDFNLKHRIVETNSERKEGKQIKYHLGSIYKYDDFLLVAFSHFDEHNRAYLTMQDLTTCLIELWNEIDKIYAVETVVLPLLGTGITRLKEAGDITDQEMLEILLWSFKISRMKFTYPARLKIVVNSEKEDRINLFKIQHIFD